ncbi:Glycosyl transferase protein [Halorhabdus tiamatea SARL4B]|uniref:Conserved hypothetical membrane protein, putative glycosyltransferase n=1 Tax=Halorhabdus tiamatea SARL4B TaxID=1033806 RepID=F7PH29_9EURY|nr:hypothetical protein [Halorhabdus tiamatea]ERJ05666.1 Glycosyl transferase protein [Halorhabdus tiamatea SARL4B]CCQ32446.1 conserved hypothetical membrane protein, putative glycosyltransferase [Halorhabdus tiamatea SARL4B]
MIPGWEIRLQEIAGNPNLTFIYFIGFVLIGALGVRFGVYALWNRRASQLPAQTSIWTYLTGVGVAAALYGLVGVLEIVTPGVPAVRRSVLLAFVLLLALTMRLIARQGMPTDDESSDRTPSRLTALALALVVGSIALAELLSVDDGLLVGVTGVAAVAFAVYGYWYGRTQLSRSMVQGTMLDTLLRHLLPVLTFGAFVPAIELVVLAGIDRAIVLHVQIVFVIMTATALMTANIKLRQNLARL